MCNCRSHNGFLTAKGLEEAAQRELELSAVDAMGTKQYLDKVGSVSGLGLGRDSHMWPPEHVLDEQHRRFLNGS